MNWSSIATVRTAHGARYAQQVGKHWAHNLAVETIGDDIRITFPRNARGADWPGDATVLLSASEEMLVCTLHATAEGQRDGLKQAVERHIDRFAFREAPLSYDWRDGGDSIDQADER